MRVFTGSSISQNWLLRHSKWAHIKLNPEIWCWNHLPAQAYHSVSSPPPACTVCVTTSSCAQSVHFPNIPVHIPCRLSDIYLNKSYNTVLKITSCEKTKILCLFSVLGGSIWKSDFLELLAFGIGFEQKWFEHLGTQQIKSFQVLVYLNWQYCDFSLSNVAMIFSTFLLHEGWTTQPWLHRRQRRKASSGIEEGFAVKRCR